MRIDIGLWDIILIVVVSLQATLLAYLYNPRWKALVLTLPIPFSLSSMALGRQVNATNVAGLVLLFAFMQGVRILYRNLRLGIIYSIVIPALGYSIAGMLLARVIPKDDATFWVTAALVMVVGLALYLAIPHRDEPGHKSPMPIWRKLPVICGVVVLLVVLKNQLQGFMTMFPMVGVIAAYESRHSLWTLGRQIPVLMLTMTPLMCAIHLAQPRIGLGPSILVGWVVFLAILLPMTRSTWYKADCTSAECRVQSSE